jgi:antitoxin YefM
MITAIREHAVIRNGVIQLPEIDYPDGTEVEVIVLVDREMDETDYLLSTEANRERMYKALEELKHPENFVSLDLEKYEERLNDA